jgi:hypothetical protein
MYHNLLKGQRHEIYTVFQLLTIYIRGARFQLPIQIFQQYQQLSEEPKMSAIFYSLT